MAKSVTERGEGAVPAGCEAVGETPTFELPPLTLSVSFCYKNTGRCEERQSTTRPVALADPCSTYLLL